MRIGNKLFYKNEPVIYFDTLKTSSMEGASTTVYAQGGRGNARLIGWDGERTVTFTMEDALISPEGLMILSGAGLIDADENHSVKQHMTETIERSQVDFAVRDEYNDGSPVFRVPLTYKPYLGEVDDMEEGSLSDLAYVMLIKDGEIISEPYYVKMENVLTANAPDEAVFKEDRDKYYITVQYNAHCANHSHVNPDDNNDGGTGVDPSSFISLANQKEPQNSPLKESFDYSIKDNFIPEFDSILVDYYTERTEGVKVITITPDCFSGNFYLEASTLFRDTNGVDMPAEFIIPNCKVQSNFTFSMASSGDPSTFTFTMDAFPDYTRFNHTQKVFAEIQMITDNSVGSDVHRHSTAHELLHDEPTYSFNKGWVK